jgi:hypothetical protein
MTTIDYLPAGILPVICAAAAAAMLGAKNNFAGTAAAGCAETASN